MEQDKDYYINGVLNNDRRILSKALTLIESSKPEHAELALDVVDTLFAHSGKSFRMGITGVPGVGKSTFIEALGMFLIEKGYKVAVLAVDPSSVLSKGSIMGDKTRMNELSKLKNAYIRPSPTLGRLGGVAGKTRESIIICEAAGYDIILVETVGVGQSEISVSSMVDFFLVLMLAGAGDELQGIKKGIIEYADAFIINKADGINFESAHNAKQVIESALHFMLNPGIEWQPPVMALSSLEKKGIADFWEKVIIFNKKMEASGRILLKRHRQYVDWINDIIRDKVQKNFFEKKGIEDSFTELLFNVEHGKCTPLKGVKSFMEKFLLT